MNHSQRVIEIKGLIRNRTRSRIVFAEEGLTIAKPYSVGRDKFIEGERIAAFRFGVKELRGYKFSFGRQYFIEIKDYQYGLHKIKLNSFYGLKNKEYYRVWADLLQEVWDFYLSHQLSYYTELYNMQQMFELAGITFHSDGVSWNKSYTLPWDKITVKSYQNYFMIQNADNPRQYKCCIFSIDWNAVVAQSLLKDIVAEYAKAKRTIRGGL